MIERERKFLVDHTKLPPLPVGRIITTGYFTAGDVAIRVSKSSSGKAKICIKGPGTEERQEFEYTIPMEDAEKMLELAPTCLGKCRYDLDGWEIDSISMPGFFMYDTDPTKASHHLWMAEWEEHEGKQPIPDPLPKWITRDVTEAGFYKNSNLAFYYGRK